jgi:hypothetical protein
MSLRDPRRQGRALGPPNSAGESPRTHQPVSLLIVRAALLPLQCEIPFVGPSQPCQAIFSSLRCDGLNCLLSTDAGEVHTIAKGESQEPEMPQQTWDQKRERQYEHIKESQEDRGVPEATAKEIAARTVNKERARAGESRQASRTSIDDISSGRRGGLRSHRGPGGRTRDQLYEEARRRGIKGRSKMSKRQLEDAVGR